MTEVGDQRPEVRHRDLMPEVRSRVLSEEKQVDLR